MVEGIGRTEELAARAEAARIIAEARPRLAIITHFGMNVWRAHPWEVAEQMTQATGIQVKAARDGMSLEI